MFSKKYFSCGQWIETQQFFNTKNPYSQEELFSFANCNESDIEKSIEFAVQHKGALKNTSLNEIVVGLNELKTQLLKQRESIVKCIVSEAAKPIVLAEQEFDRALLTLNDGILFASTISENTVPMEAYASGQQKLLFSKRFPIGIIAAITPFNFPLNLVMHKLIPSIISKSPLILKPSPQTSMTALLLADCFNNTSFNSAFFQVCTTNSDNVSEYLVSHSDIDIISFTGSAKVGALIQKVAVNKKVLLECGGAASMIICKDVNLKPIINSIIKSAYAYSGQTCISLQHIFCHSSLYDELKQRLISEIRNISFGNPNDKSNLMSSIISTDALQKINDTISQSIQEGAIRLTGNRENQNLLSPTLIENCSKVF